MRLAHSPGRLSRIHHVRWHHALLALLVALGRHAIPQLRFSQHAQARDVLLGNPTACAAFLVIDLPLLFGAVRLHISSVSPECPANASGGDEGNDSKNDETAHVCILLKWHVILVSKFN